MSEIAKAHQNPILYNPEQPDVKRSKKRETNKDEQVRGGVLLSHSSDQRRSANS